MKKSVLSAGYDQEEAYFFKRDRELIEQRREQRAKLELVKDDKAEEARSQQTVQSLTSGSGKGSKAA